MMPGGLSRPLGALVERRVVAVDEPLSARPGSGRTRRYRVADPYLRFWLRFLDEGIELVHRGRPDLLLQQIRTAWPSYAGRAVEPLIRRRLERLLPRAQTGEGAFVGGWWTRTNNVEVDLVGVDRLRPPRTTAFVGSIKWRRRAPFDRADLAALHRASASVPGTTTTTPTVAVSRSGVEADVTLALGPQDL